MFIYWDYNLVFIMSYGYENSQHENPPTPPAINFSMNVDYPFGPYPLFFKRNAFVNSYPPN